jgi:hypothetical protein
MKNVFLAALSIVAPLLAIENAEVGIRPCREAVAPSSMERDLPAYAYGSNLYTAPLCLHQVEAIGLDGRSIQIEDGSEFRLSFTDIGLLAGWNRADVIEIFPNTSWFRSCKYLIVNHNNNSTIEANLSIGPVIQGPYFRTLEVIYYNDSDLYLSDGTHWRVHPSDWNVLLKWYPGDVILIGSNRGLMTWFGHWESILINVTTDNYVRTSQL